MLLKQRVDLLEKSFEESVGRRVAEIMNRMDPFEPVLRRFGGVFSREKPRPEDGLDARSSLLLKTWAYQQRDDPSFRFMYEWVMDGQGRDAVQKGNPTPETILWSRSLLTVMPLWKREVDRLGGLYEDILNSSRGQEFDDSVSVE